MASRLEVRNVSKTFGDRTVLRDVDLTVEPGELHGLIGQNGSGKSTLAKIISGYHAPDAGAAVRVDGAELHLPVRLRAAPARTPRGPRAACERPARRPPSRAAGGGGSARPAAGGGGSRPAGASGGAGLPTGQGGAPRRGGCPPNRNTTRRTPAPPS